MKKGKKYNLSKKRKNIFAIFSSKLFFFLLIIIFSGVVKLSFDKFREWSWARSTLISQEEKIGRGGEREKDLKNMLDYLQTEGYLIRIVKEKLNLVRPGEKVIFVIPEEEKELTQEKETENKKTFERFLQTLKEIF